MTQYQVLLAVSPSGMCGAVGTASYNQTINADCLFDAGTTINFTQNAQGHFAGWLKVDMTGKDMFRNLGDALKKHTMQELIVEDVFTVLVDRPCWVFAFYKQ